MNSLLWLQIDFPALTTALLAGVLCSLHGNFLVLRRQSLLGDAISHAVLPGIVLGFVLTGSRSAWPMVVGATLAGLLAAALIEIVRRLGRIETGASMGVIFTLMFALGVVLIEQAAAHSVDLDADCVLYGQLEDILWLAPTSWESLLEPAVWAMLPRELTTLFVLTVISLLVVGGFWKELKITTFDPDLATTLGYPAGWFHFGMVALVALAAIASFEAVGSILVIALLICPAAAARLLTDSYRRQLQLSVLFGGLSSVLGYFGAAFLPAWLGWPIALNAAGMIGVMAGLILTVAALLGSHGVRGRRRSPTPAVTSPLELWS